MNRVAIYCRLSKEDREKKEESESVVNQRAMLLHYAKQQGWEVYRVYCDEDYSGADRNRPAFLHLLQDAKNRRFNIVLCKTQSRFTRDMELVERLIHGSFPLWGIRFVSVVDGIDTAVKGNKKARQISGLINEWYLEDLSDNIRSVLDSKRRSGQYIGSIALYGYEKDPGDKNKLVIDPPAAAVVREIYRRYLEGEGITQIAAALNESGVPNPTAYKRARGIGKAKEEEHHSPGKLWSWNTIKGILRNEMYMGTMVQGKNRKRSYKSSKLDRVPEQNWIRIPGTHPPIIQSDMFWSVQKRMCAKTRPRALGTLQPFAGHIKCIFCGAPMRIKRAGKNVYLTCNRPQTQNCHHGVPYEAMQHQVLAILNQLAAEHIEPLQSRPKQENRQLQEAVQQLDDLKREYDGLEHALAALYLEHTQHLIEMDQYEILQKALFERYRIVRLSLEYWEKRLQESIKTCEQSLTALHFKSLTPKLVAAFIDKIEAGKQGGHYLLRIHWAF